MGIEDMPYIMREVPRYLILMRMFDHELQHY
jgi:hypothetical protein